MGKATKASASPQLDEAPHALAQAQHGDDRDPRGRSTPPSVSASTHACMRRAGYARRRPGRRPLSRVRPLRGRSVETRCCLRSAELVRMVRALERARARRLPVGAEELRRRTEVGDGRTRVPGIPELGTRVLGVRALIAVRNATTRRAAGTGRAGTLRRRRSSSAQIESAPALPGQRRVARGRGRHWSPSAQQRPARPSLSSSAPPPTANTPRAPSLRPSRPPASPP